MKGAELKDQIWRAVTNRSLSTWLLIVVTAVLVIGSILPNPEYMTPDAVADLQARSPLLLKIGTHFNSRKLATGYFFGFIGIYLIVSATLCSIDRFLNRRRELPNFSLEAGQSAAEVSTIVPSADPDEARAFLTNLLRRRLFGAMIMQDPVSGAVIFRRGRFGFWGSILFHTVLITALFGVVVFYLGGTRGKLVFTEGQHYRLEKSRFIRLEKEPLWGLRLPNVELELMEHHSLYARDAAQTALDHLARFRVTDLASGDSAIKDVRVNFPLRLDGSDFLLMTGGFSPRFVISRPGADAAFFDSFINLRGESGTKDDFFTEDGLHVEVRFFPDLARERGQPMTKSPSLHNPAALITVSQQGNKLFDDVVPVGTTVQVSGYSFAIPEVRRWIELEMADEPGIGFFFFIAFFGIVGVTIRLLDPDEQLVMVCRANEQGTSVSFYVNSRHFSALLAGVASDSAQAAAAWGTDRAKGREI